MTFKAIHPDRTFSSIHMKNVVTLDVSHGGLGVSAGDAGNQISVWESSRGVIRVRDPIPLYISLKAEFFGKKRIQKFEFFLQKKTRRLIRITYYQLLVVFKRVLGTPSNSDIGHFSPLGVDSDSVCHYSVVVIGSKSRVGLLENSPLDSGSVGHYSNSDRYSGF